MKHLMIAVCIVAGSAYAFSAARSGPADARAASSSAQYPAASGTIGRPDAMPSTMTAEASRTKLRPPCTVITALPYTISAPGRYCYASDLATAGAVGVNVQARDVDIDCANFQTTLAAGNPGAIAGVLVNGQRSVTIRNCRIDGFDHGILASGNSPGLRVVDNRIHAARIAGVSATGDGAQVVGNRITNMSQSPAFGSLTAISLGSPNAGGRVSGVVVAGNTIVNLFGGNPIAGIHVAQADAPMISGNTVMELRPSSQGRAVAISLRGPTTGTGTGSLAAELVENQLMSRGAPNYIDIEIESPAAFGRCLDNIVIGVNSSLIAECASGGGNVVVP